MSWNFGLGEDLGRIFELGPTVCLIGPYSVLSNFVNLIHLDNIHLK